MFECVLLWALEGVDNGEVVQRRAALGCDDPIKVLSIYSGFHNPLWLDWETLGKVKFN